jgi:hypothetical protein
MKRRMFLKASLATLPLEATTPSVAAEPQGFSTLVPAGVDRFGQSRGLGFSSIAFKASSQDSKGDVFIFEHSNLSKGGPPRHLHFNEDEWLYVLGGEFGVEVGTWKYLLNPAPKSVPKPCGPP